VTARPEESAAWEYSIEIGLADYLRLSDKSAQTSEGKLEYALGQWGAMIGS